VGELVRGWWLIGAGLLVVWPFFMIGHVVRAVIDHRVHGDRVVTLLAVVWPLACVAMAGTLAGSLSPPLFGVPIAMLLAFAWIETQSTFLLGVAAFYGACAVVVAAALFTGGSVNPWFLAFWPLSLLVLMTWRTRRRAARADRSCTDVE
jgi:hypothetical protein